MSSDKEPKDNPVDYEGNPITPGKIIKTDETIKLTETTAIKRFIKKSKEPLLIIICVLVIVGAVTGIILLTRKSPKQQSEQQAYNQMIALVNKTNTNNQFDLSINVLKQFLAKYPSNANQQQLYTIYNDLGTAYTNKKDYKNAMLWQNKALAENPQTSFIQYFNLARICELNKDKACAIQNYKAAQSKLSTISDGDQQTYKTFIALHLKALGS